MLSVQCARVSQREIDEVVAEVSHGFEIALQLEDRSDVGEFVYRIAQHSVVADDAVFPTPVETLRASFIVCVDQRECAIVGEVIALLQRSCDIVRMARDENVTESQRETVEDGVPKGEKHTHARVFDREGRVGSCAEKLFEDVYRAGLQRVKIRRKKCCIWDGVWVFPRAIEAAKDVVVERDDVGVFEIAARVVAAFRHELDAKLDVEGLKRARDDGSTGTMHTEDEEKFGGHASLSSSVYNFLRRLDQHQTTPARTRPFIHRSRSIDQLLFIRLQRRRQPDAPLIRRGRGFYRALAHGHNGWYNMGEADEQ